MSSFRRLLPFAIVAFLAYVGFSLPLPLFPELFLDPEHSILPHSFSISTKMVILGIVMAGFPLGQFIGAPILGRFSDIWGRRRVILFSLLGSTLGYLSAGLAVQYHSVVGIFMALTAAGFCEGNIAIAQAVIADIDDGSCRTTHFGWLNVFVSLGFIVGPLLGGQLVQPRLQGALSFAMPFYMASIITLLGISIMYFFARETWGNRKKEKRLPIWQILKQPRLKQLFIINFFVWMGLFFFWRYLPVFLERVFDFRAAQQSYVFIYDELIIILSIAFALRPLARKWSRERLVAWGSLLLGLVLAVVVLPGVPEALIFTIPPIGFLLAIVMTNSSSMVSYAVAPNLQGQVMGSLTALQVLAEVFTAVTGGIAATMHPALPLFMGALLLICGSVVMFRFLH